MANSSPPNLQAIDAANIVQYDFAHPFEHRISRLVSICIVYPLEMIQVNHEEAGGEPGTSCTLHLCGKDGEKVTKIEEPGKRVGARQLLQTSAFRSEALHFLLQRTVLFV